MGRMPHPGEANLGPSAQSPMLGKKRVKSQSGTPKPSDGGLGR